MEGDSSVQQVRQALQTDKINGKLRNKTKV